MNREVRQQRRAKRKLRAQWPIVWELVEAYTEDPDWTDPDQIEQSNFDRLSDYLETDLGIEKREVESIMADLLEPSSSFKEKAAREKIEKALSDDTEASQKRRNLRAQKPLKVGDEATWDQDGESMKGKVERITSKGFYTKVDGKEVFVGFENLKKVHK